MNMLKAQQQLTTIRKALGTGGYVLCHGETNTAGVVTIEGRVGTLQVKAILNGLGTPLVGGVVVAFAASGCLGKFGKTLARFRLGPNGLQLHNKILEFTLDRMDPFA